MSTFVIVNVVSQVIEELHWDADRVALLMSEHKIRNRGQLAKALGISRETVRTAFDESWQGRATAYLIAVMCSHFRVRLSDVVREPVLDIRHLNKHLNNGQSHRIPNSPSRRVS